MPVSKRLKDGIQVYLKLLNDYQTKKQAVEQAQDKERAARRALQEKISEVLLEANSCALAQTETRPGSLIEVDGKIYLLDLHPKDFGNDLPSHIREMKLER